MPNASSTTVVKRPTAKPVAANKAYKHLEAADLKNRLPRFSASKKGSTEDYGVANNLPNQVKNFYRSDNADLKAISEMTLVNASVSHSRHLELHLTWPAEEESKVVVHSWAWLPNDKADKTGNDSRWTLVSERLEDAAAVEELD